MPINWQKVDIGPEFKGLLRRRQMQLEDPNWVQDAKNIDGYGGTWGKRFGTQIVNGYGSFTTLVTSTTTDIAVADYTGFVVGPVTIGGVATNITSTGLISGVPSPGGRLTVSPALPSVPLPWTPAVQTLIAGPIQTLFQAIYRNQTKRFIAAIGNYPYNVLKGQAPTQLTPLWFPSTVVTTYSADPKIVWLEKPAVAVGDTIYIPSLNAHTKVTGWFGAALVDPPLPSAPASGATVLLMPNRGPTVPDRPPEMVQYGGVTFYTSGPRQTLDQAGNIIPNAPLVIEQGGTVRRCGVKPGQIVTAMDPIPYTGGQLVAGQWYGYRFRYFNGTNGQESEGSIEQRVKLDPGDNAVQITLPPSPDPQVTEIRLYRTTANGGGAWYRVPSVISGGTTITKIPNAAVTVIDISADNVLGSQMRNLQDACINDTVAVLAIWGQANRLVGIDPVNNWVVYSDQPDLQTGRLKGESWPANNQIFVSYDDGDRLTGIAAFFDSLLIFKEHSVWRVTGVPPDLTIQPVHFRQDQTGTGAISQRSIVVDHNDVLFRGTDAIYKLNRFEGQAEGFQSARVSTPIDDLLQDKMNLSIEDSVFNHAVYFRFKRQFRCWLTTTRLVVLQFEATEENAPTGWAEWELAAPPTSAAGVGAVCSCIARYDAALFRGNIPQTLLVSGLDAGVFIATTTGLILQMDIGQADYGSKAYEVFLRSLWFPPAGRGISARVRATDWQVATVNITHPTIRVETDQLKNADGTQAGTEAIMQLVPDPENTTGGYTQPPDTVDVIAAGRFQYRMHSTLFVAPGQYHQFSWRETDLRSMYRLSGWTYWFQALTPAHVRRRTLQPTKEPTEHEPDVVVTVG